MHPASHKYVGLAASLTGLAAINLDASVQVSWNPSSSSAVAGYYVCLGTNSGSYYQTNAVPASQSYASFDLNDTNVYYLAVAAFDTNNNVSAFSNEIQYTNGLANAAPGDPGNPTAPPFPTNTPPSTNPAPPNPNPNPSGTNTTSSGPSALASLYGIPPTLTLGLTNSQPLLNIVGTVGATMNIECTTNPSSLDNWTMLTNVQVTNIADIAATNPPANPDALDLAFVPANQQIQLPASETNMLFYRAVMPYDYVVLAGQVLPSKGYPSRLIAITMPGLNDDACYVTPQSSYIHYLTSSNTFELRGSGSTIRNVADTLAGSLGQSWTTASEFIYTNGVGEILATVVATEDPATDPVAGSTPSSQIVINF